MGWALDDRQDSSKAGRAHQSGRVRNRRGNKHGACLESHEVSVCMCISEDKVGWTQKRLNKECLAFLGSRRLKSDAVSTSFSWSCLLSPPLLPAAEG